MLTRDQINFLNKICPNRWAEANGVVDVKGDVNISEMNLTRIPVQFGKIYGSFDCSYNALSNLENFPKEIYNHSLIMNNNVLTSLEGFPKIINNHKLIEILCSYNNLTNLVGLPDFIDGKLNVDNNNLINLIGCPIIETYFNCTKNKNLTYLWGLNKTWRRSYDNVCNLNIFLTYQANDNNIIFNNALEVAKYIKTNKKFELLKYFPAVIRDYFPSYILNDVDNGIYENIYNKNLKIMKYIKNFSLKINEGLGEDFLQKEIDISDGIKKGLLLMISDNISDKKYNNIIEFCKKLSEDGIDSGILPDLVEKEKIYDFYIKYQNDIDAALKDEKWFTEPAENKKIYTLFDYVIEGAKLIINKHLVEIYSDLQS